MTLVNTEYVGLQSGSVPTVHVASRAASSATAGRYQSHPAWGMNVRQWEGADTHRLNEAHWAKAADEDINEWLRAKLSTLRARAFYEARNNPTLSGICETLADDVVGPDGPQLQVLSDDDAYNEALEQTWRQWFSAPTFRKDVSGTSLLKMWIRNLPRAGEFIAQIDTDEDAEGPVAMRLRPIPSRRLESPTAVLANPQQHVLGIEFDRNESPVRYWVKKPNGYGYTHEPVPPDLIIHGFFLDEECQARGFPWFTPALGPAAELRDYDYSVQHAARRAAENNGMMYSDHPDATFWNAAESTTIAPGMIPMAPPGWKPFAFPATQPAAQYPDFRQERQRDIGRPFCMPLLMIRLDSSKHNYSSARLDTQSYDRRIDSIQTWLSGSEQSVGTLNRLADLVGAEARFTVPALRRKPKSVIYVWTWPPRGHVDPSKETDAETAALESRTMTFSQALAKRGTNLDTHMQGLIRVEKAFEAAGVEKPQWLTGPTEQGQQTGGTAGRANRKAEEQNKNQEEPANA